MKVRKGFVTNSSSTNFGAMLVTSLAGISAASLISPFEYDEKAKEKAYVKLVVEAPTTRVLCPGQSVSISAQLLKVKIIEGKLEDTVSVVGGAGFQCTSGQEILTLEPQAGDGSGVSTVSFKVIDDLNQLLDYQKAISFIITANCEGETLRANISFTVPAFSVSPGNGIFVVDKGENKIVKFKTNFYTSFEYDFSKDNMLEAVSISREEFEEEVKLIEDIEDVDSQFDIFTCKIFRDYRIDAPVSNSNMSSNYRAIFLRECILLPRNAKLPVVIKTYNDENSNKRTEEACNFAIKVVKFDDKTKTLKTDIELTNDLNFEFEPILDVSKKRFTMDMANKALEDANIKVEILPNDGLATEKKPYATYRIYSDAFCEAQIDKIQLKMKVSANDSDIKDIEVKAQLRPRIDLKGLITQFIEYPVGTYAATAISLGNVDSYIEAIDKLTEIKLVGSGSPKYDIKTDVMSLRDVPESIEDFIVVQTIHHELCHKIEQIQGDNFYKGGSWGERHSYFIQYLSDAAKILADIERGVASDIKKSLGEAIHKLFLVYNNPDNIETPPNEGEINNWFGVRSMTPHEIFNKYIDFSTHCRNTSLQEETIKQVEKYAASDFFPGNIKGKWKFSGSLFDQGEWIIMWQYGNVFKINIKCPGYEFKELSRKWLGGNRLVFEIRYEVTRLSDQDEDELIAIFDAGTFDPSKWTYPEVNKFTVKWKAGRTLSDCILGDYMDKEVDFIKN